MGWTRDNNTMQREGGVVGKGGRDRNRDGDRTDGDKAMQVEKHKNHQEY